MYCKSWIECVDFWMSKLPVLQNSLHSSNKGSSISDGGACKCRMTQVRLLLIFVYEFFHTLKCFRHLKNWGQISCSSASSKVQDSSRQSAELKMWTVCDIFIYAWRAYYDQSYHLVRMWIWTCSSGVLYKSTFQDNCSFHTCVKKVSDGGC